MNTATNFEPLRHLDREMSTLAGTAARYGLIVAFGYGITFELYSLLRYSTITPWYDLFDVFGIAFILFSFTSLASYLFLQKRVVATCMKHFAEANNFTYTSSVPSELRKSHIFLLGDRRIAQACITVPDTGFSFFNFQYSIKNGKHTTWRTYTVLVIPIKKPVPNVYIHMTENASLPEPFTEAQRLRLKVDATYEQNHAVYSPLGYEIETLQLLDYAFIQTLSSSAPHYDIELLDEKMFVYMPYNQETVISGGFADDIQKLFTLYEQLSQPLIKIIEPFTFTEIPGKSPTLTRDLMYVGSFIPRLARTIFSRPGIIMIVATITVLLIYTS